MWDFEWALWSQRSHWNLNFLISTEEEEVTVEADLEAIVSMLIDVPLPSQLSQVNENNDHFGTFFQSTSNKR